VDKTRCSSSISHNELEISSLLASYSFHCCSNAHVTDGSSRGSRKWRMKDARTHISNPSFRHSLSAKCDKTESLSERSLVMRRLFHTTKCVRYFEMRHVSNFQSSSLHVQEKEHIFWTHMINRLVDTNKTLFVAYVVRIYNNNNIRNFRDEIYAVGHITWYWKDTKCG